MHPRWGAWFSFIMMIREAKPITYNSWKGSAFWDNYDEGQQAAEEMCHVCVLKYEIVSEGVFNRSRNAQPKAGKEEKEQEQEAGKEEEEGVQDLRQGKLTEGQWLLGEVKELRGDVADLKEGMRGVKSRLERMSQNMADLHKDITALQEE
jgi:hypothetical protein